MNLNKTDIIIDPAEALVNDEVSRIVKGVSRKYGKAYGIDPSDLEQELWLKLLEEQARSNGGLPNTKVIARTTYNKAVDIYRKERRRWDSKSDMVSEDNVSKLALEFTGRKTTMMAHSPFTDAIIHSELKDAINTLEPGSRERKFVVMKGYVRGVFDIEEAISLEPTVDPQKLEGLDDSEHRMAKALDLCGSGSGTYRKLKKNVKKVMKTYFGSDQ